MFDIIALNWKGIYHNVLGELEYFCKHGWPGGNDCTKQLPGFMTTVILTSENSPVLESRNQMLEFSRSCLLKRSWHTIEVLKRHPWWVWAMMNQCSQFYTYTYIIIFIFLCTKSETWYLRKGFCTGFLKLGVRGKFRWGEKWYGAERVNWRV